MIAELDVVGHDEWQAQLVEPPPPALYELLLDELLETHGVCALRGSRLGAPQGPNHSRRHYDGWTCLPQ